MTPTTAARSLAGYLFDMARAAVVAVGVAVDAAMDCWGDESDEA